MYDIASSGVLDSLLFSSLVSSLDDSRVVVVELCQNRTVGVRLSTRREEIRVDQKSKVGRWEERGEGYITRLTMVMLSVGRVDRNSMECDTDWSFTLLCRTRVLVKWASEIGSQTQTILQSARRKERTPQYRKKEQRAVFLLHCVYCYIV